MKLIGSALIIIGLFVNTVHAQISANVSVNMSSPGYLIPDDFIGFSFETRRVNPDSDDVKGYFFDFTNTQLITLFHQMGIKSLRVGGFTVMIRELRFRDSKISMPCSVLPKRQMLR